MIASEWLLIFGMFLATFSVRYPVLAFVSRMELPEVIKRALKYIPAAVLSAIIFPAVVFPEGAETGLRLSNDYLVAGVLAALIAWRTKNLLVTIVVGMGVFLVLRILI